VCGAVLLSPANIWVSLNFNPAKYLREKCRMRERGGERERERESPEEEKNSY